MAALLIIIPISLFVVAVVFFFKNADTAGYHILKGIAYIILFGYMVLDYSGIIVHENIYQNVLLISLLMEFIDNLAQGVKRIREKRG